MLVELLPFEPNLAIIVATKTNMMRVRTAARMMTVSNDQLEVEGSKSGCEEPCRTKKIQITEFETITY